MNHPNHSGRAGAWRLSWTVALALVAAAALPACQFGTLNGQTTSGGTVGKQLYISGYSTVAGATMRAYVLDNVTADPYASGAQWVQIGSAVASNTAYVDGAGNSWYGYGFYVTPVPNAGLSYRWPAGGLLRLKTTQDGTNTFSFDQDFFECAFEDLTDYLDVAGRCQSATLPVTTVVDVDPISASAIDYLSWRETAPAEASQYYSAIGAAPGQQRNTLAGWKTANSFPGGETIAYYFNDGDLGFGRQMHCRATAYNAGYACYVTNFNNAAGVSQTIADTISSTNPVATVAMEYWPGAANNKVRFFVYNAAGNRLDSVALDSEGAKSVPGLCLSCHGGTYDAANNKVTGASFLPFDAYSFLFSTSAGYTRDDQEEAFRKLNNIVNHTAPAAGISDLIGGWYHGNVAVVGTEIDDEYIPAGWTGSEKAKTVYNEVVEDYCRTCHIALESYHDWDSFSEFSSAAIEYYVCDSHIMPHAERTRAHFWQSPARAHLINGLNLKTACP